MKNSKKLIDSATCAVVLRNLNADKHHNKSRLLSTAVFAEYRTLGGTTESQMLSSGNYRDSQQWWLPKKKRKWGCKGHTLRRGINNIPCQPWNNIHRSVGGLAALKLRGKIPSSLKPSTEWTARSCIIFKGDF